MINFSKPPFPRPTTRTEKADVQAEYGVTAVYRMSYNESPLGPSPEVVAAIQAEAKNLGEYPTMGDESLRQALAHHWGQGLKADNFFTGCSGYETLELAARAILKPNEEMIVCPPMFGAYLKIAVSVGVISVQVPLRQPAYTPDIEAILSAITPQTRIILLCNPNNPTGTMMPAAEMAQLVDALPPHVLLITDEVYSHFVTSDHFPDTLAYIKKGKPIIMIQTFSKAYGLAGLRLGYAMAPVEIANYIGGYHRGFHQNRLSLVAGVAALQDQVHLQKNITAVLHGKTWLYEQFDQLGLDYIPSQTNFIVVKMPADASRIAHELQAAGVMVRPLKYPGLANCLRVTVTVQEGNELFIESLQHIMKEA